MESNDINLLERTQRKSIQFFANMRNTSSFAHMPFTDCLLTYVRASVLQS